MPSSTFRPQDGGQLITRASAADVGAANYSIKRNWRRDLTDEIFREGWDYWNPLPNASDYQTFPFPTPNNEPISLVHVLRRPNGDAAVIVATKSTIYRFNTDLSGYMDNLPSNYVNGVNDGPGATLQPYFLDPTRWQIIGSGFSTTSNARRWEVSDINGSAFFNNNDDLPVEFRVEWDSVRPLCELREQGIVCVGTIGDTNGILMLADITQLNSNNQDEVLNVLDSGSITVTQPGRKVSGLTSATSDGTHVVATQNFFASTDVGRTLVWFNNERQVITAYTDPKHVTVQSGAAIATGQSFYVTDLITSNHWDALAIVSDGDFFTGSMVGKKIAWADGTVRRIVYYINPRLVKTDTDIGVAPGPITAENPITYISKSALQAYWLAKTPSSSLLLDRIQYRILWSEVGFGSRFAILVPVTVTAGSRALTTKRMNKSLQVGDALSVVGAAVNGGVLTTNSDGNPVTLTATGPGVFQMSDMAASGNDNGSVQRASSVGSIVGFNDIQDDGAAVLRMLVLQTRLVVYTDTNIFLGVYTAVPDNPFQFERIQVPHGRSLHFRHTLASVQNQYHIYAGKNRFYQFDLTTRTPSPIPSADGVSNLFFDYASIDNTDQIYSTDNELTSEIWIICPQNTNDPVIAFDYIYHTISSIDIAPTAAATVKEAVFPLVGETGDWFLMGTANGVVLQYGLSTEVVAAWPIVNAWDDGKRIWYRRSARPYNTTKFTYNTNLTCGLNHAGDPYNEKRFTDYVLQVSSLDAPSPTLTVTFYQKLGEASVQSTLGSTQIVDAVNHGLIPLHCITHMIRDEITTSVQYPIRLHSRTYDFQVVPSKSYHRR